MFPKGKKQFIITIISSVLAVALVFTLLNRVDWKHEIGSILKKQINSSLNGDLNFDNFDFEFSKANFLLSLDNLLVKDLSDNTVIKANKLSIDVDITRLLALKIKLKRIASEYLQVNAMRDDKLEWNLANLFKSKKKLFAFSFGEVDLGNIDLEVIDQLSLNQVNYEGLRLEIKPESGHYNINIETQKTPNNYIRAFGMIAKAKKKNLLSKQSKLKLQIINLEPLSISLMSALLASDAELNALIDSYIGDTTFSLNFDYDNYDKGGKLVRIESKIANSEDIEDLVFESRFLLDKDIQFEKASLVYGATTIDLGGFIKDWQEADAELGLTLDLVDLNLFDLVDRFPELEYYIPGFILEIFNILHGNDYLNGRLNLSSKLSAPDLLAKLKINTKQERLLSSKEEEIVPSLVDKQGDVIADLHYEGSKIVVREFILPVNYSELVLSGNYDLDEHSFQIHLAAEDLPLSKIRPIAASIPMLEAYRTSLTESAIIGYASFDLDLSRQFNAQKQLETVVKGPCRFAKLSYKSLTYPLTIGGVNASFEIDSDQVIINNFGGYAYHSSFGQVESENYIEAKGRFRLSKPDIHFEMASPTIDAQTLIESGIIRLLSPKLKIDLGTGSFNDVLMRLDSNGTNFDMDLDMDMDSVGFLSGSESLTNLSGSLSYKHGRVNFNEVSFSLNDKSLISLDGSVENDLSQPRINIKADNLDFVKLMNFVNGSKLGIEALAGSLGADLDFYADSINGRVAFKDLDFNYKNLKLYPITGFNADLLISNNLDFDNIRAHYGESLIENGTCMVENYKSKDLDRIVDLGLYSKVNIDDFYTVMPDTMKKFLKISGKFPVNIFVKGNQLKSNIKINADISKANDFNFGDWFIMDKEATRFKVISKFTLTPQLISSTDCRLVFIKDTDSGLKKTKVRSTFHIEDYKNKDELSYFLSFKTKQEDGISDLSFIEPHISSLAPLNLKLGAGGINCDTFGNFHDRQTICEFKGGEAVAQKYGIGDLHAKDISVDLLSIANKPLEVQVALEEGDWNSIPYRKLKLDLSANGNDIFIRDIKARSGDGVVRGEIDYDIKTFDSRFKLEGSDLPAHDLAQGIWGFGSEVPEGIISGVFEGTTSGYMPDPMFYNMEGTTNLILKNGKLSQLILMQKVLTAVNTLRNFDLNNIFQTLVTYKGGTFDYVISSIKYDHGVMSSEKLLLKAQQMELNLNGYFDYNKDQLWVKGSGLIPKKSKSILQGIGIGKVNLGNLLSLDDLSDGGSMEKSFFDFSMVGPISDPDKTAESLKSNFKWQ
ncbi:MAG: hypothetical protein O3C63_03740 [Cyanobacteria bacterium]|nr:hypothetical protein [Cyanobacteriota bacterium]MDA1020045.1 hypothetical protein [Cyanobacteriota bacterium]